MSTHPFVRLLSYASQYRGRVAHAAGHSVLNKVMDLAPPALIGAAVDIVVRREESWFSAFGLTDLNHQLFALAALTVVIWGLESLFEYLQAVIWRNLAQAVEHDLRVTAYQHIQQLDLAYFHHQSAGGLMAVLNDDINQLERFLDSGADDLIQVTTSTVLIVIAFFALAPEVAWLAMLPIPLIIWGSFRYQRLLTPRYLDVRARVGELNGQLGNNLAGIATIKSYATEPWERERIATLSANYREANRQAIGLSSAFSPLIRLAIVIGFTATLVVGGQLTLAGTLAVGVYSMLVFMTQRLLWPLTRLGQTFDLYQRARASTERVMDLLDVEVEIVDGDDVLPRTNVRGELAYEDVTFGYAGREPLFQNFSLRIPPGATLGVVGTTGAGKTSLVSLLLRFFDPAGGRILLDGEPTNRYTLRSLRDAIGLVSQEPFLFHGTVRENIVYGTQNATDADVRAAARAAEALAFVEELPDGFDTVIGERGLTLSAGQRQRISIARAVLKDPPIFVFDEATSAVDNETEAAMQRSLEAVSRDRTTIVIAHRLSTVRNADEIIVLRDGEVAERGTHEELVALGQVYARLWRVQTGDRAA